MITRKRLNVTINESTAELANNKKAKIDGASTTNCENLSTLCLTDCLSDQSKQQKEENNLIQKVKEENEEEEEVDNANIIVQNVAETQTGDVEVGELQDPYALNSCLMYSELQAQVENTEYEEDMKPKILNATCNSESDDTDDTGDTNDQNWETTSCSSQDDVAKKKPAKKSIIEINEPNKLKRCHFTDIDNEVFFFLKNSFLQ